MIYAIGDIHGQHVKLVRLLKKLSEAGMEPDDTLVFVGDYVDRGPNVAGVFDTLIELRASRPNTVFLRGNHEQMMLDARQHFDPEFDADNSRGNTEMGTYWFAEGGAQTLKSYGPNASHRWFELIPDEHWQFMLDTQLQYDIDDYTFVHAGLVPPGRDWEMDGFDVDPRLWIRYEFIASEADFDGKVIVFGHTPTRDGKPLILWNKVAIDTGAGYNGPLTAVHLPSPYDPSKVIVFQA